MNHRDPDSFGDCKVVGYAPSQYLVGVFVGAWAASWL